jgi:hypothetical protein
MKEFWARRFPCPYISKTTATRLWPLGKDWRASALSLNSKIPTQRTRSHDLVLQQPRGPRWRYIRYRDGSEELYNHATDPLEHVNQVSNPQFANIKERLKKYLPIKNTLPSTMKNGGLDSCGKRVERLQIEGIPKWLGKDPVVTAVK